MSTRRSLSCNVQPNVLQAREAPRDSWLQTARSCRKHCLRVTERHPKATRRLGREDLTADPGATQPLNQTGKRKANPTQTQTHAIGALDTGSTGKPSPPLLCQGFFCTLGTAQVRGTHRQSRSRPHQRERERERERAQLVIFQGGGENTLNPESSRSTA